ncbi:MAG TPA: O-antigen ligase family protein, partial [Candidatus Saccharimonadales bacterium]|nr:O-antigen ligase family protein [Candidatus Saccharimonadales bacterium]
KSWLALLFSGVAVSMMGIVYKFSGLLTYDGRLHIFYDSPNQLGMFLAPIFIVGLVLFLRENLYWRKLLFLAGLFLLAVNLYFTYSYGTWMALAVAITVVFWLKHKTLRSRVGILILVFLAAIAIGQMRSQKMADLENMGGRSSIDSRIMIWKAAGLMIESNPLFGIGPGNFQNKYLEYQKYFPPYLEWAVPQPHNLFLAFWLEAGFLGLVGFVFLLVQFFKDNKKAIENNHLYGTLCFAVMLYLLVHGLIDTTYWRNDMAIIFWTIISINTFLSSKGKAQGD